MQCQEIVKRSSSDATHTPHGTRHILNPIAPISPLPPPFAFSSFPSSYMLPLPRASESFCCSEPAPVAVCNISSQRLHNLHLRSEILASHPLTRPYMPATIDRTTEQLTYRLLRHLDETHSRRVRYGVFSEPTIRALSSTTSRLRAYVSLVSRRLDCHEFARFAAS